MLQKLVSISYIFIYFMIAILIFWVFEVWLEGKMSFFYLFVIWLLPFFDAILEYTHFKRPSFSFDIYAFLGLLLALLSYLWFWSSIFSLFILYYLLFTFFAFDNKVSFFFSFCFFCLSFYFILTRAPHLQEKFVYYSFLFFVLWCLIDITQRYVKK